jgi:putative oxidoreductase
MIDSIVTWRGHRWLGLGARLYLGWVFVAACLHKIAHPAVFALDTATYDVLPLSLVNPVAIMLPWVELFAGVMLIGGLRVRAAAMMTSGMMVMFIVALVLALHAGLDMSCGCFASQAMDEDPIGTTTVLRDLSWLALGVYIMLFDREAIGLEQTLSPQTREPDAVT